MFLDNRLGKIIAGLGLLFWWTGASAQTYVRVVDPFPVVLAGDTLVQPFTGGLNRPDPHFLDWDQDGLLDLIVNDRDGRLQYWRNTTPVAEWVDGKPVFELVSKRFLDVNVGVWFSFYDFDGDGDFDLLCQTPGTDRVSYWSNQNGAMNLETSQLQTISGSNVNGGQVVVPTITDINADGWMDLFVGALSGQVTYYRGVGFSNGLPQFEFITNYFEDIRIVWVPGLRHGSSVLEFYDLDNDGDQDLIWGDFYQPGLFYLENYGDATNPDFADSLRLNNFPVEVGFQTAGFNAPRVVDLDGDGDGDLVVGVLSGAYGIDYGTNLYFLRNDGSPEMWYFTLVTDRLLPGVDLIAGSHPTLADLDGDGDRDLLIGTDFNAQNPSWSGQIFYFQNQGNDLNPMMVLADSALLGGNLGSSLAPAFFDMDGDGDLDATVGEFNGRVLVYKNVGTAQAPQWVAEPDFLGLDLSGRACPSFGDVDQDGDDDFVVGSRDGQVIVFWNRGSATNPVFNPSDSISVTIGVEAAPTVAVDGTILAGDGEGELYRIVYQTSPTGHLVAELLPGYPWSGVRITPAVYEWGSGSPEAFLVGSLAGGLQFFRDSTAMAVFPDDQYQPNKFTLGYPYPNPTNGMSQLELVLEAPSEMNIALYDLQGRLVEVLFRGKLGAGKQHLLIQGDYASGFYLILVNQQGRLQSRKLIFLK
ncbi:MAG: T9SS type A sorting domain-containing protein [Fidelibacterota bacterium]